MYSVTCVATTTIYTRLDFPHEKATLLQGLLTDGFAVFSRILFENETQWPPKEWTILKKDINVKLRIIP